MEIDLLTLMKNSAKNVRIIIVLSVVPLPHFVPNVMMAMLYIQGILPVQL